MAGTPPKPLSLPEWDSLIDEYNLDGAARLHRWTGGASIPDICLSSLIRKDTPIQLKLHILTFLEHHSLEDSAPPPPFLLRLLDALRSVIQSPSDPFALKDQFLTSTTVVFITSLPENDEFGGGEQPLSGLVELLLTIINRPNHGLDRHTRGVACECLRQLELAFPCLLSEVTPHLWSLCHSERTHVSQWYVLLLSTAVLNIVKLKPSETSIASISNATIPLIPFNLPQFLIDRVGEDFVWKEKEICYKELRKVVAFLLECPQYLTSFGLVEFMVAIIPLAEELELQASLLRVQFSWLLYTFKPLLCHIFLGLYVKFLDSFEGQEFEVASRLLLLSKESHHHLVFRLLALHWMLGFFALIVRKDEARKRSIIDMSLRFYPTIFDSLAMKALKLDLLAYCSRLLSNNGDANVVNVEVDKEVYEVKLFKDGLVSVSAFKWLPPWNTETAVAFRTFHKFLIGGSPHSDNATSSVAALIESNIFEALQKMLVESTSEFKGLVPVVVAFIDRLLGCHKHRWLGEHLLKTLDKHLLPKLKKDYNLGSYFPIFERISENDKVSPSGLLNLLLRFMVFLVEKHGPDNGLRSWHHGSKILGICRTMLVHHHSSSLFTGLSHLLASICLFFPDLEVRDSARFYLRMLIGIPGKKLKRILNTGERLPGLSPSNHSGSFFNLQSPSTFPDLKKSTSIASHIYIERATSLLVKQSWSLSLPNFGTNPDVPGFFEGIRDNEAAGEEQDLEITISSDIILENDLPHQRKGPLRVMDAKNSEIVNELRRHFLSIPDYRHMPGLKIKISCNLRFDSEPLVDNGEKNKAANAFGREDRLPALYAVVLKFTSSAPYGPISSFHIPFLLGTPPKSDKPLSQADSLAIVCVENGHVEEEKIKAPVCIELEPREPMPGMVDVFIETNADNGQVIKGQLQSISVGIEDMFLRAIVPDGIADDVPSYYVNLFNALWEACETASSTGRETFVLKGGKGIAAISGTRSVKLLEVPVTTLVEAVERHLAPFVVCVIGEPLVDMVKAGGMIKDVIWKDSSSDSTLDTTCSPTSSRGALYLKYFGDEADDEGTPIATSRKNIGYFHILIFLPPRFHLLFQMEIHDFSTLVRIRTDHWPCLAYVDDYLEALFVD